jgi:uncharacterized membrane protein
VLSISESMFPMIYLRNVLGAAFTLFLPGYVVVRTLFTGNVPFKTGNTKTDAIEVIGLSLFISMALVTLIGLILNYTTWGVTFFPIMLTLPSFTIISAIIALLRENQKIY